MEVKAPHEWATKFALPSLPCQYLCFGDKERFAVPLSPKSLGSLVLPGFAHVGSTREPQLLPQCPPSGPFPLVPKEPEGWGARNPSVPIPMCVSEPCAHLSRFPLCLFCSERCSHSGLALFSPKKSRLFLKEVTIWQEPYGNMKKDS